MAELMRWFPFYVDRFLTSKRVRRMNADQVGAYILLLIEQWDNGPIGDDDADLKLVAKARITTVRKVLAACFKKTKRGWVNDTLEDVRKEQVLRLQRLKIAGTAGAKARWEQRKNSNRIARPLRSQSDPNAIREDKRREEVEEKEITTKPRATRARGIALPNDWTPNDDHRQIATEQHVEVGTEATRFRDWASAKGQVYRDWDAAFRNWLRRARSLNGNGAVRADTGITKRWEAPKEPDYGPPPDPAMRAAGLELVRQAVAAVSSVGSVDAEISDPAVVEKREAERKRQLALVKPGGKP